MTKQMQWSALLLAVVVMFTGQASAKKKSLISKQELIESTVQKKTGKGGAEQQKEGKVGKHNWMENRKFFQETTKGKERFPRMLQFKTSEELDKEILPLTYEQKATWDNAVKQIELILKEMQGQSETYKTHKKTLRDIYRTARKGGIQKTGWWPWGKGPKKN
ncbi:hypothetical protein KKA53_01000 [Candidatus Dependentiae bacterium]|nr:hypothetical protein [Candidatus Dependentiae bacterium]